MVCRSHLLRVNLSILQQLVIECEMRISELLGLFCFVFSPTPAPCHLRLSEDCTELMFLFRILQQFISDFKVIDGLALPC